MKEGLKKARELFGGGSDEGETHDFYRKRIEATSMTSF
jgi:hypothetical protein